MSVWEFQNLVTGLSYISISAWMFTLSSKIGKELGAKRYLPKKLGSGLQTLKAKDDIISNKNVVKLNEK